MPDVRSLSLTFVCLLSLPAVVLAQQSKFNIWSLSVDEDANRATVSVQIIPVSEVQTRVSYATYPLDAINGADFFGTSGTLTFPAGVSTRTFTVDILDDTAVESVEKLGLRLFNPTNGASLDIDTGTVTIVDNDVLPEDPNDPDDPDDPGEPDDPVDPDLLANIDSNGNLDTRDTLVNLPAFPGATGPGWLSTGGRGAKVYCVNTLEDVSVAGDGLLSFREVAESIGDVPEGPRNMTFCVSGKIDTGTKPVQILDSNLTIAGQTAPAPGVVLVGYRALDFDNDADDIIVRHIDSKPKDTLNASFNTAQRNVTIGGGRGIAPDNLIFDHMSMQGSTDDTFTVFVNTTTSTTVPSNITVSQSIMGEGDTTCLRTDFECGSSSANGGQQQPYAFPNHSMAAQISSANGTPIKNVAIVANVMGNTVARSPQLRSVSVGEVVNNVMYNVFGIVVLFGEKSAPSNGYVIGNIFKHGPDTRLPAERQIFLSGGNFAVSGNTQIERDGTVTTEYESNGVTNLAAGPRTTLLGNNELNVDCVGASVPVRDSWDARMIAEMNGTGTNPVLDSAEVGIGPRVGPVWMPGDSTINRFYEPGVNDQGQRDWSTYIGSNTHPANYDTDNDGIADSFENDVIALDTNDAFNTLADIDHTTVHPDGYTYFEKWTHNLAASCATGL